MKKLFSIISLAVAMFAINVVNAQGSIHAGYVQNNLISTYTVPVLNTPVHPPFSITGT